MEASEKIEESKEPPKFPTLMTSNWPSKEENKSSLISEDKKSEAKSDDVELELEGSEKPAMKKMHTFGSDELNEKKKKEKSALNPFVGTPF